MTLDSLVQIVNEKTGIGEDNATLAVKTVLQQLKGKMPEVAHPYIDGMLGDEASESSQIQGAAADLLGKVFGS